MLERITSFPFLVYFKCVYVFVWRPLLKKQTVLFHLRLKSPFDHRPRSSTELSEIIGAWIAKVVLDRIGQQTNVEATCSESKETKFRQNVAPQKKELKKKNLTHLQKQNTMLLTLYRKYCGILCLRVFYFPYLLVLVRFM